MYYVYILRSKTYRNQYYVGFTTDLRTRFRAHNSGSTPHTAKYRPWELVTYTAFKDRWTAIRFEQYLKSHAGKAFASKRLWPQYD